ncbi:nitrate/nitrite transporter NarK [Kineococcus xinjiangensis]|uniref:Nitrate/nitrite transporter NarK n=1 Tax=Kineococcus xinjiangensis TaxID=512762 RepID=A0A2S6IVN2_9ACTN|nr:MFS transporter [Kineococcus xinjiangensis]PPK98408.1 nitrate/nitrite transporter NarK [Kineococcus xinjiangensis]
MTSATATAPSAAPPAAPRGARLVLAVGTLAYGVAVLHRTSLSAAGIDASTRFGIGAGSLSTFAVLQLLVYAALQVPVGVLIDRFGARVLVVTGAVLMSAGQAGLAVATEVETAVAARILLGAGDAMTFVSVLRIVSTWFPPRRTPVLVQLVGLLGQVGQIASVFPLMALLHSRGWTTAYGSAAALGALTAVLAWLVLRDAPPGVAPPRARKPLPDVAADLRASWRHPGTRLGLYSHFATPFAGTAFVLLWGYPFLVSAQGLSPAGAGALLTLFVCSGAAIGPALGALVGRHPLRRSWLVLSIVAAQALAWAAVLAWPGRAPLPLLVVLVVAMSAGAPASMIGFDYARTSNPAGRLGGATGIVNVGGFFSALLVMLLIGVALDLQGAGTPDTYTLGAFKTAMAVQFPLWGLGVVAILRARAATRRKLAAEGFVVPPVREVLRREVAARRGGRGGE